MAGLSDFLENELLDHVFRNAAYSQPATVYVGLYTATPSDAGGGTEVSGNNYARTAVTFGAAASGAIANSGAVTFPQASASWGTVTHFGIFDASTNGNLLAWAALSASKAVGSGDTAEFAIGELDISLD
jgi:hypothetical protein